MNDELVTFICHGCEQQFKATRVEVHLFGCTSCGSASSPVPAQKVAAA